MWKDPGAIGTQHEHIITAELCEFELYPAKVTGDLLTSGPTTRHSWLQWKCSLVHQRVLCWLQMWFRLECGIGGTQPHYCWSHAGLFAPAAVSFSYRAIKWSCLRDAIEFTRDWWWKTGLKHGNTRVTHSITSVDRTECVCVSQCVWECAQCIVPGRMEKSAHGPIGKAPPRYSIRPHNTCMATHTQTYTDMHAQN